MISISRFITTGAICTSLSCLLTGCSDTSGEFEYVAIGASDAAGIGASPLSNGYVYRIQEALKSDGRDVGLINLGIPGASTDDMKGAELPVAIDEEPELVTIFAGANDIVAGVQPEDFQADIDAML